MHDLLGSLKSGNWSDSKVLDSAGLSCRTFTRNRGAISQLSMCVLMQSVGSSGLIIIKNGGLNYLFLNLY